MEFQSFVEEVWPKQCSVATCFCLPMFSRADNFTEKDSNNAPYSTKLQYVERRRPLIMTRPNVSQEHILPYMKMHTRQLRTRTLESQSTSNARPHLRDECHAMLCGRHLLDSAMMMSTTIFPGRNPPGRNSVASTPCRAHPSIMNVPHKVVHSIVHDQPSHPCTRNPVALLNPPSMITPMPMSRKNPPAVMNSVPFPLPHRPIW